MVKQVCLFFLVFCFVFVSFCCHDIMFFIRTQVFFRHKVLSGIFFSHGRDRTFVSIKFADRIFFSKKNPPIAPPPLKINERSLSKRESSNVTVLYRLRDHPFNLRERGGGGYVFFRSQNIFSYCGTAEFFSRHFYRHSGFRIFFPARVRDRKCFSSNLSIKLF